ncbi:MAG: c-type cytochrome [Janthinobacterium lividum]
MESLESNKAFAAVLLAGMAFVGAGLVANALVKPTPLHEAAIKIDTAEASAAAPGGPATPAEPLPVLLASADAGRGEAGVKAQGCVACHSFNQGGKAGVGPNLYGTLGAPHGHMEGYAYSAALKGKAGPWTLDEMNEWLLKPSAYAPGTKMSYAGLGDAKKRADIIMYLRSLSPNPVPLPEAPAGGATPAAATPADAAAAAPK